MACRQQSNSLKEAVALLSTQEIPKVTNRLSMDNVVFCPTAAFQWPYIPVSMPTFKILLNSCQSLHSVQHKQHLHDTCIQPRDKTAEELGRADGQPPSQTILNSQCISSHFKAKSKQKLMQSKWDRGQKMGGKGWSHCWSATFKTHGFLTPIAWLNWKSSQEGSHLCLMALNQQAGLRTSAASKDKHQLEIPAVPEMGKLNQKGSTFLLWLY